MVSRELGPQHPHTAAPPPFPENTHRHKNALPRRPARPISRPGLTRAANEGAAFRDPPDTRARRHTQPRQNNTKNCVGPLSRPPSGLEALGGKCPTARKERGSLNACSTHARSLRAIHHQPMRMRLRTRPRGHEVQSVYKTQGKQ